MASAIEPLDRPRPHRIPLKPDLVGERVRAETGCFRGDSARIPSRTGSVVACRPDFLVRAAKTVAAWFFSGHLLSPAADSV